jgi:DNA polymerase-3 subunit epsilon
MRQIVLDTETTGLEHEQGHRVIEIGCVELVNRRRTNRTFHRYLHPDRDIDIAAEEVHGISRDHLANAPRFAEIAAEFLEFIAGAELIIHNADFDVGFLNNELRTAGRVADIVEQHCRVTDTLALARRLHPGQRNSLDALCRRYGVDNSNRDYHGALLDAQLLAEVYLAMTGGQAALSLDAGPSDATISSMAICVRPEGLKLALVCASRADIEAHEQQLDLIAQHCAEGALWRRLDG